MTLVQDNPASAHQEKKEIQGIISIQSLVTCGHVEDLFEYPPIQDPTPGTPPEDGGELLEQMVSKLGSLGRQGSCESVGSLSEDSRAGDEGPSSEDSSSEDGEGLSKEGTTQTRRSTSVASDATNDEGSRDSGIEAEKDAEAPPMVIPDEDLMLKISTQVEFYFSDANVVKDKFLLKHIRRNKEGFVSLKLVSSFKKVKQLTKDWRVVAHSLGQASSRIEINEQRTKIRRVDPLPEIDDSPVTCAVLALDLPLEKPSVESVSKIFGGVGEISFVRVLRAGGPLPPDVKSLLTKFPVLGTKHCAWIEFETTEAAKTATELSTEGGMKVALIVPESQKKQEKLNQQKQQATSRKSSAGSQKRKHSTNRKNSYNNNNNSYNNNYNNNYSNNNNNSYNNNNNNNFYINPRRDSTHEQENRRNFQRRKAISLPSAQNPFMNESRKVDYRRERPKSKSCTEFPVGSPPRSWIQRHLLAAAAASAASTASPVLGSRPSNTRVNRTSLGSLPLPDGILRFPKGPDGSKGFLGNFRLRQINELKSSS